MVRGARRWSAMGLVLGVLVGAGLVGAGMVGASAPATPDAGVAMDIDVLHRSPLLVTSGDAPPLEYELVCASTDAGAPCAAAGEIHVKAFGAPAFTRLPLHRGPDGRLRASLDPALYGRGFAYYAVVREARSGAARTLPPGGPAAPHHVYAMPRAVLIDLGAHRFGQVRRPAATIVRGRWGSGPGRFGLDAGSEQATTGPGAFDVAPDGRVVVLDQVNRRLLTYSPSGRLLRSVDIPFDGGTGDLALAPGGRAVVAGDGGPGAGPVVAVIAPDGTLVSSGPLAERTFGMVRWSPLGAVVHQTPSDTWLPATAGASRVLPRAEQASGGLVGRPVSLPGGSRAELIVDGDTHETHYALVARGRVLMGWRVRSRTPLGEVALAEPHRGGLLVVQRVWTETRAEFGALHLTAAGLGSAFSIPAVEWADASPHGRFRVGPLGLYHLRSAEDGVSIVRYDLGRAS